MMYVHYYLSTGTYIRLNYVLNANLSYKNLSNKVVNVFIKTILIQINKIE